MKIGKYLILTIMVLSLSACTNKDEVAKILKENPDVLAEAIIANPAKFMDAVQIAARAAQEDMKKQRDMEEQKQLEEAFEKPLVPEIRADETIRGPKDAPLTLVEYSDFECPYCARGFETVEQLMKKYDGKIRVIYKHLPLSFHQQALPAAKYYEAIRLQSDEKAFSFHDEIFKNQPKLRNGEKFLKEIAKKVGADMKKLEKDLQKSEIMARIDQDQKEAAKFGMQGTPGFLLNGVPVRGAYPFEYFEQLIQKLQEKGKVKL